MTPFASSFVPAFQASISTALEKLKSDVFSHEGVRALKGSGCKPEHLSVLTQIFGDVPHFTKALLRFDSAAGDLAVYLVGLANKDYKYGLVAQRKAAQVAAARDHARPLTFEDGEAASLNPLREAAYNPALRAERDLWLETLPELVSRWAQSDAMQDSAQNQPKRCQVYEVVLDGLLEGTVTRTATGRLSLEIGQKELAARFATNEVYIRNWLRDLRGHLDRLEQA